jgi:hypothetical protein
MEKIVIKNILIYDKKNSNTIPIHIQPYELKIPFDELRKEYKKKYGNKYSVLFISEQQTEIQTEIPKEQQKIIVYPDIKKTEFNPQNLVAIKEYNKTLNNY